MKILFHKKEKKKFQAKCDTNFNMASLKYFNYFLLNVVCNTAYIPFGSSGSLFIKTFNTLAFALD